MCGQRPEANRLSTSSARIAVAIAAAVPQWPSSKLYLRLPAIRMQVISSGARNGLAAFSHPPFFAACALAACGLAARGLAARGLAARGLAGCPLASGLMT